jgi:DnaK suppressor protein
LPRAAAPQALLTGLERALLKPRHGLAKVAASSPGDDRPFRRVDIVCHMAPLYKARADGYFFGRLVRDGLTLEKLKNYRPSEKEPFMNDRQREYFRAKLLAWKEEILRESRITLQTLQEENVNHPDLADRASSETDRAIELRARDRQRKLISKIDAALQRIEDNTYGYCEETGEPISLKRLEARPIATLSVEAQERHEKREKVYRDE